MRHLFQRRSSKCAWFMVSKSRSSGFYAKEKKISAKKNRKTESFKLFIKLNALENLFPVSSICTSICKQKLLALQKHFQIIPVNFKNLELCEDQWIRIFKNLMDNILCIYLYFIIHSKKNFIVIIVFHLWLTIKWSSKYKKLYANNLIFQFFSIYILILTDIKRYRFWGTLWCSVTCLHCISSNQNKYIYPFKHFIFIVKTSKILSFSLFIESDTVHYLYSPYCKFESQNFLTPI